MAEDKTALDFAEVRNSGTAIGDLASDVNGFSELNDINPQPGEFEVGGWLKTLVTGRRDALYEHCNELQQTLQEVSRKLKEIATEIEGVDQNNADAVNKLNGELTGTVGEMQSRISSVAPGLSADASSGMMGTYAGMDTQQGMTTEGETAVPSGDASGGYAPSGMEPGYMSQQADPFSAATPGMPMGQVTPGVQGSPGIPATEGTPVTPGIPMSPMSPLQPSLGTPMQPTQPTQPMQPLQPAMRANMPGTEPQQPLEPMQAGRRLTTEAEPLESAQQGTRPIATEGRQPLQPMEQARVGTVQQPVEPVQQGERVATEPAQPLEPRQFTPAQPAIPAEPAQLGEPAQYSALQPQIQGEAAIPAEPAQLGEPAQYSALQPQIQGEPAQYQEPLQPTYRREAGDTQA